jgi:hypothetical protein
MNGRFACSLCVMVTLVAAILGASQTQPRPESLAIPSLAGRDNFDFYCANCHGADARGNGPLAVRMMPPPPDLTLVARRNGGAFPRERIAAYVRGSHPEPVHGTTDMPDWWQIFIGLDPADVRTAHRIVNIVEYVESLRSRQRALPTRVPGCFARTVHPATATTVAVWAQRPSRATGCPT